MTVTHLRKKREIPTLNGIVCIDKPLGWTSHDVVARIRRVAGQREVGHAGTLDPLATGVLLVALGSATKLTSYLMDSTKGYRAVVVLGAKTVTDDGEAPLQEQHAVGHIDRADLEHSVRQFVGRIQQLPPMYSAVRQDGEKLYVSARKGKDVERQPREVRIDAIDVRNWSSPRLTLDVTCGAGTYIRALARDVGATLGVGGYLHALRRVSSGTFHVVEACALSSLSNFDELREALQPPDRAVLHLPACVLSSTLVERVRTGLPVRVEEPVLGSVRLYDQAGKLIALGTANEGLIKPFRVFGGGSDADAHRR